MGPDGLGDGEVTPPSPSLPVALGVTLIVIPSPHRGKQGPGGQEFP